MELTFFMIPTLTTPNLKKFAESGAKFNNHITQHSQCSPSRNAMISGRFMLSKYSCGVTYIYILCFYTKQAQFRTSNTSTSYPNMGA